MIPIVIGRMALALACPSVAPREGGPRFVPRHLTKLRNENYNATPNQRYVLYTRPLSVFFTDKIFRIEIFSLVKNTVKNTNDGWDMLIQRSTYVDVYYNENEAEIKKALRERERLIVSGYELMAGDTAEKKPIP